MNENDSLQANTIYSYMKAKPDRVVDNDVLTLLSYAQGEPDLLEKAVRQPGKEATNSDYVYLDSLTNYKAYPAENPDYDFAPIKGHYILPSTHHRLYQLNATLRFSYYVPTGGYWILDFAEEIVRRKYIDRNGNQLTPDETAQLISSYLVPINDKFFTPPLPAGTPTQMLSAADSPELLPERPYSEDNTIYGFHPKLIAAKNTLTIIDKIVADSRPPTTMPLSTANVATPVAHTPETDAKHRSTPPSEDCPAEYRKSIDKMEPALRLILAECRVPWILQHLLAEADMVTTADLSQAYTKELLSTKYDTDFGLRKIYNYTTISETRSIGRLQSALTHSNEAQEERSKRRQSELNSTNETSNSEWCLGSQGSSKFVMKVYKSIQIISENPDSSDKTYKKRCREHFVDGRSNDADEESRQDPRPTGGPKGYPGKGGPKGYPGKGGPKGYPKPTKNKQYAYPPVPYQQAPQQYAPQYNAPQHHAPQPPGKGNPLKGKPGKGKTPKGKPPGKTGPAQWAAVDASGDGSAQTGNQPAPALTDRESARYRAALQEPEVKITDDDLKLPEGYIILIIHAGKDDQGSAVASWPSWVDRIAELSVYDCSIRKQTEAQANRYADARVKAHLKYLRNYDRTQILTDRPHDSTTGKLPHQSEMIVQIGHKQRSLRDGGGKPSPGNEYNEDCEQPEPPSDVPNYPPAAEHEDRIEATYLEQRALDMTSGPHDRRTTAALCNCREDQLSCGALSGKLEGRYSEKLRAIDARDKYWINKVGVYGVASAQYHWGRMAALILRLLYYTFPDIACNVYIVLNYKVKQWPNYAILDFTGFNARLRIHTVYNLLPEIIARLPEHEMSASASRHSDSVLVDSAFDTSVSNTGLLELGIRQLHVLRASPLAWERNLQTEGKTSKAGVSHRLLEGENRASVVVLQSHSHGLVQLACGHAVWDARLLVQLFLFQLTGLGSRRSPIAVTAGTSNHEPSLGAPRARKSILAMIIPVAVIIVVVAQIGWLFEHHRVFIIPVLANLCLAMLGVAYGSAKDIKASIDGPFHGVGESEQAGSRRLTGNLVAGRLEGGATGRVQYIMQPAAWKGYRLSRRTAAFAELPMSEVNFAATSIPTCAIQIFCVTSMCPMGWRESRGEVVRKAVLRCARVCAGSDLAPASLAAERVQEKQVEGLVEKLSVRLEQAANGALALEELVGQIAALCSTPLGSWPCNLALSIQSYPAIFFAFAFSWHSPANLSCTGLSKTSRAFGADEAVLGAEVTSWAFGQVRKLGALGRSFHAAVIFDPEELMPETLWAAAETVRGGGLVALVLPDDCGLFGGAADLTGGGGGVCPAARHSLFPRLVQALHAGGCLVDAQLRLLRPFSPPTRELQTREFVAGGGVPASTMELQEVADVEAKEAEALLQGGDAKVLLDLTVTSDQRRVLAAALLALTRCPDGPGQDPLVITGRRGRGKSTLVGLLIAGAVSLPTWQVHAVVVTAPAAENVAELFRTARQGLTATGLAGRRNRGCLPLGPPGCESFCVLPQDESGSVVQVLFALPENAVGLLEALKGAGHCTLLVIDEAASLPVPELQALLSAPAMGFVLAGTMSGCE
ncbi:unnamed protein product, partial [Polarella glacialis]